MQRQNDLTIDQFTRQALAFANAPSIRNDDVLSRIVELAEVTKEDTTLDVACGTGLLVCAFAPKVGHAAGIDLTPAMLQQARRLQQEQGLENVTWTEGDVTMLPYEDDQFSVVTSRYAFHHLSDPLRVLREMVRVAKPGGRILVIDSTPEAKKADAFNAMERLRDSSHVRALPCEELVELFLKAGLKSPSVEHFRLAGNLDSLLARSFPNEGDEGRIRTLFHNALEDDFLDVEPRRNGSGISYAFPISILSASRAKAQMV